MDTSETQAEPGRVADTQEDAYCDGGSSPPAGAPATTAAEERGGAVEPSFARLEAALRYARLGLRVVPLHNPTSDGHCSCRKADCTSIGKHPRIKGWTIGAPADKATIRKWWTEWPDANVGIVTGAQSGIFALDVDPRHGGDRAMQDLEAKNGQPPDTPTSATGSDGNHFLFRHPGWKVPTKANIAPGLDVRGDGGLIVAPPSRNVNGEYEWLRGLGLGEIAIAEAPPWVLDLIRPTNDAKPMNRRPGEFVRGADVLNGVPEGERDETLFRYVSRLKHRRLAPKEVEVLVLEAASRCDPPFPPDEALKKVERAFKDEGTDSDGFALLDDEQIEDLPSPEWLIDGILPSESLAVLYGPPKVGKTFLGLDWGFSICTGRSWCGHAVKTGSVVYVYSEGSGKLKCRTRAWKRAHDVSGRLGVQFITRAVHVLDQAEVKRLFQTIRKLPEPPTLIALDTLARCIQGGDENSAKDVGAVIGVADRLREEFKATVLIIHHSGKNGAERGSTALRGAADTMLRLVEKDEVMTLDCEAQKDARDFTPIRLERQEIDLGNGETSCVLQLADEGKKAADLRSGFLNEKERGALQALLASGPAGARSSVWQKAAHLPDTSFKRVRKALDRNGYVGKDKGSSYTVTTKGELALNPIPDLGSQGPIPGE